MSIELQMMTLAGGYGNIHSTLAVTPLVDIVETTEGLCLFCNLPGVAPSDLTLTKEGEGLHIKGFAGIAPIPGKIHVLEFSDVLYETRVRISAQIDASHIKASYANGLLRVLLPHPAPTAPVQIPVSTDSE